MRCETFSLRLARLAPPTCLGQAMPTEPTTHKPWKAVISGFWSPGTSWLRQAPVRGPFSTRAWSSQTWTSRKQRQSRPTGVSIGRCMVW